MKTRFSLGLHLEEQERLRLFQVFEYLADNEGALAVVPRELSEHLAGTLAKGDLPEAKFEKAIGHGDAGIEIVSAGPGKVRIYDKEGSPDLNMVCQIVATRRPTPASARILIRADRGEGAPLLRRARRHDADLGRDPDHQFDDRPTRRPAAPLKGEGERGIDTSGTDEPMNYDLDFRYRRALQPEGLSTVMTAIKAVEDAIQDARNAGLDPERDPAVTLLARHVGRIASPDAGRTWRSTSLFALRACSGLRTSNRGR